MIGLKIKYEDINYIIYISNGVIVLVTSNLDDIFFDNVKFILIENSKEQIDKKAKPILKKTDDFFKFYTNLIVESFKKI